MRLKRPAELPLEANVEKLRIIYMYTLEKVMEIVSDDYRLWDSHACVSRITWSCFVHGWLCGMQDEEASQVGYPSMSGEMLRKMCGWIKTWLMKYKIQLIKKFSVSYVGLAPKYDKWKTLTDIVEEKKIRKNYSQGCLLIISAYFKYLQQRRAKLQTTNWTKCKNNCSCTEKNIESQVKQVWRCLLTKPYLESIPYEHSLDPVLGES